MDESTMRDLLGRAAADEPPLGSLVADAVRGGRRMRRRRRVGGGLVAGLAVLVLVSGVSFGVAAVRANRPAPVAATAVIRPPASPSPVPPAAGPRRVWPEITPDPVVAAAEIKLPLDRFRLTTAQIQEYVLAGYARAGECMRRYGFAYDLAPDLARAVTDARARVDAVGAYGHLRAWGLTDTTLAATYGYHVDVMLLKPAWRPDYTDIEGLGPLTPTKLAVLTGVTRTGRAVGRVHGLPVPKGGCAGEAGPDYPAAKFTIVDKVAMESDRLAVSDPRVALTVKAWSGCMWKHGYKWTRVTDAGRDVDIDTPVATERERKEAVTDVACKQSSGYTATVVEVVTSYQNAQIAAHPAEFDAVADSNRAMLEKLDQAITAANE